ncbi:MAG: prohibitin family protein [Bdellovibrionales bacterium]|nr:prohibitin family protein [Bdellovibrionales bacterium]
MKQLQSFQKYFWYVVIFIGLVVLLVTSVKQVNEGERGIKTTWGKMVGEPLMPGIHFFNPISSGVILMDVREDKLEGNEPCFTKDTQLVEVAYALTLYPDPAMIGKIYSQFGTAWKQKVIKQTIQSSIKDVTGQFIADDLVSKREEARTEAFIEIQAALKERNIEVTRLDITNLDFDDAYEKAVEAKVVAVQRAIEAKNRTEQIKEEAKQKIEQANADAEAMRIKTRALSENKSLVDYEAVQKWDGKLPQYMLGNGSLPFIHLNQK